MKTKFIIKLKAVLLVLAIVFNANYAFSQDYLGGANFDFTASTSSPA